MTEDAFARRVTTLGTLADPVRRALYRFVSDQPDAVSREQAADGVEVPRHTAKFHLERLVDEGLLVTEFRRLTGRTGPGAGRPAKLYRRHRKEIAVSVPSRRYDLVGQVLADAVERALDGTAMHQALEDAAAAAARTAITARPQQAMQDGSELEQVASVLGDFGYEPRVEERSGEPEDQGAEEGEELVLGNCPYDLLAADHRGLVCGLNQAFVTSVGSELGCAGLEVRSVPRGETCCVRVAGVSGDAGEPARDGAR